LRLGMWLSATYAPLSLAPNAQSYSNVECD
jgi:hypothetical protein